MKRPIKKRKNSVAKLKPKRERLTESLTPFGADLLTGMLIGFVIGKGNVPDLVKKLRELVPEGVVCEACVKCGMRRGALFEPDACVFRPVAPVPQEGAR